MARWRLCASLAAALAWASAGSGPVQSASPISLQRDGAVTIAGRVLRCGSVRNVLDPRLPNLGVAAPGVLVLNPGLLNRQSEIVRLFVFHHECGHHHVGASELKADCWAVTEGVKARLARPRRARRGVPLLRRRAADADASLRRPALRQPRSLLRRGQRRAGQAATGATAVDDGHAGDGVRDPGRSQARLRPHAGAQRDRALAVSLHAARAGSLRMESLCLISNVAAEA